MSQTQRYWDGERWTDHVAPIASPALPSAAEKTDGGNALTYRLVALLASVAIIIGSLGPWATAFLSSKSGMSGDGVLTLILAVAGTLVVLVRPSGSRWLILATVCGILAAIIGGYDIREVTQETAYLLGHKVHVVSVGWGLWVTTAAAVVFAITSYFYMWQGRERA